MERRIRQRLELQEQHAQQMHFKQLRQDAQKEEEEQFRQQVGLLFPFMIFFNNKTPIPHTAFVLSGVLVQCIS